MFVAVYRWRVSQEDEPTFRAAWVRLTELIREHCGSLGSRLHRSDDGLLVAYAQWPSRDAWQTQTVTGAEAEQLRRVMAGVSERIRPDLLLQVTDDLTV